MVFQLMYVSTFMIVHRSFTHLLPQHPCVVHAISVDMFHDFYLSVCDKPLVPSVCPGVHAAWLCPCVVHGISVDVFHVLYLSLRDKPLIPPACAGGKLNCVSRLRNILYHNNTLLSCDTMRIPAFLVTAYKSFFHALDYSFLQSDFSTFLCLLLRNQFVHATLMLCIPREVPGCRIRYIFLFMMRSMFLRHNFLACVRHFYARQLTLRSNVHGFCEAGGCLRLIELLCCSRDSLSESAYFSLPSLFIMIHIISILTCHCPDFACLSTKGITTPSASPSYDDQPLCHRVLTYGGG